MEREFDDWLARFASLGELFSSRHQLYSKLCRQQLNGVIEENVTIVGPVHVGLNSLIRSGAVLTGPLIVGPDCVIGNGAKLLDGTFIGTGTSVGSGAAVIDSIMMNRCVISENCVIQSSVLGFGVVAKAGCLIGDRTAPPNHDGTYVGDEAELRVGSILRTGSVVARRQVFPHGAAIA